MNLNLAKQFVAQFVKGDFTPEEYATFLHWLKGATLEELNEIADEHEALHKHWDVAGVVPAAEWKERLEGRLDHIVAAPIGRPGRVLWFTGYKTWVAAASAVVLLGAGAVLYTQQGGGKLTHPRPELPATAQTVVNPSGGVNEKQVILPDGSKVFLNVASTLKYPATFASSERVVELSGEASFEVKPNAAQPFRVLIRDAEVDVLGTNFNVRAYADEPVSKTTLIEGSVKIESGSNPRILEPGQQAVIVYPSTGDIRLVPRVDIEDVLVWKKGYFRFTNEEFQTVARVLSRYYNVEIQCDPDAAVKIVSGSVSRDKGLTVNLNQFKGIIKYSPSNTNGTIVKVTL